MVSPDILYTWEGHCYWCFQERTTLASALAEKGRNNEQKRFCDAPFIWRCHCHCQKWTDFFKSVQVSRVTNLYTTKIQYLVNRCWWKICCRASGKKPSLSELDLSRWPHHTIIPLQSNLVNSVFDKHCLSIPDWKFHFVRSNLVNSIFIQSTLASSIFAQSNPDSYNSIQIIPAKFNLTFPVPTINSDTILVQIHSSWMRLSV